MLITVIELNICMAYFRKSMKIINFLITYTKGNQAILRTKQCVPSRKLTVIFVFHINSSGSRSPRPEINTRSWIRRDLFLEDVGSWVQIGPTNSIRRPHSL